MLIAKTSPQGVDIPIHKLQAYLHEQLILKWGIQTAKYRCYPRCYRNKKGGKWIAENYEGNGQYLDAYWDDKLSVVSFFGISSIEKYDVDGNINVHLVFFCNLKDLKPDITHRPDEEVRKDVQLLIEPGIYGLQYKSTEMWAENCLREYNGSATALESKIDIGLVHCFRINLELNYNKNICLS